MKILLYGLPIFCIIAGLYNIIKYYIKKFTGNYQEVKGTIVDYKLRSHNSSTTYSSIIEYEVNGYLYRYVENSSSNIKKRLGKKIKLLYNINNPVDSISLELSTSLIFIFVGLFFLVMIIFLLWISLDLLFVWLEFW